MIVSNTYSNAKIEGCNVTFLETKTILDGVNVANAKLDDIPKKWAILIAHLIKVIFLQFLIVHQ